MNFRQWQHWRWSGAGRKESPTEKSIKTVASPGEKPNSGDTSTAKK